jgi:hypothetical protein
MVIGEKSSVEIHHFPVASRLAVVQYRGCHVAGSAMCGVGAQKLEDVFLRSNESIRIWYDS